MFRETLNQDRVKTRSIVQDPDEDNSLLLDASLANLPAPMTYPDIDNSSQDGNTPNTKLTSTEYPQLPEELTGDPNGEGSFGYSQKFFHISDGNLYSVFSPLQGRSYGVKPSFLRKHRCMVQETKGKKGGRRNVRRGLKFHNFIPSESVTSEREEGPPRGRDASKSQQNADSSRAKNGKGTDEVWKVHAKCKLQEEHGTKQITVASWSHSSNVPASGSTWSHKPVSAPDPEPPKVPIASRVDQSLPQLHCSNQVNLLVSNVNPPNNDAYGRPSVLQQYLESGQSSNTPSCSKDDDISLESSSTNEFSGDFKTRRRKAVSTKRVVPYSKYLTMLDESPLDLSAHKDGSEIDLTNSISNPSEAVPKDTVPNGFSIGNSVSEASNPLFLMYSHFPQFTSEMVPIVPPDITRKTASASATLADSLRIVAPNVKGSPTLQSLLTPSRGQGQNALEILPPGTSLQFVNDPNHQLEQDAGSRTRRKPSQRTLIRQKLEDTFKQNGFLVKTKQVSDGDATFCKFKQLRKYTRYYLKSWHQHLPEEVHKLWKGFLPPKTPMNLPRGIPTAEVDAIDIPTTSAIVEENLSMEG